MLVILILLMIYSHSFSFTLWRRQSWRRGTSSRPFVRCTFEEMTYLIFYFFTLASKQSSTLSSATQYTIPSEFGENGERSVLTLSLPPRFPQPILVWFIIFILNTIDVNRIKRHQSFHQHPKPFSAVDGTQTKPSSRSDAPCRPITPNFVNPASRQRGMWTRIVIMGH